MVELGAQSLCWEGSQTFKLSGLRHLVRPAPRSVKDEICLVGGGSFTRYHGPSPGDLGVQVGEHQPQPQRMSPHLGARGHGLTEASGAELRSLGCELPAHTQGEAMEDGGETSPWLERAPASPPARQRTGGAHALQGSLASLARSPAGVSGDLCHSRWVSPVHSRHVSHPGSLGWPELGSVCVRVSLQLVNLNSEEAGGRKDPAGSSVHFIKIVY